MSDPALRLSSALSGRYRIEGELGEGGMATVYLADDVRHERKVALKVLKPELAAVVGAERFLAEIKTTANLQHPHILPLYDSGEADGFLYYVMPYVEGESLRERLDRERQLPVEEAARIATNVAEALDYAHGHGVIHRDVKPANILLQAGKPVISDFGIALAVGVAGGGRLTETGLSLGTPHYMSPEQATGEQGVGPATDVYALGCVLYEMLVGQPPYTGSTAQAVLGKIVTGEPDAVTAHRRSAPANVDAVVRRALEKVPADRFGSAGDFARALADPGFRHGARGGVGARSSDRLWKRVGLAATALALALAAVTVWPLRPADEERLRQRIVTVVTPPAGVDILGGWGLQISPDERTLVFYDVATGRLYRRDLGRSDALPIPGTESAWMPFFSPDGEWIAFFDDTENRLKRVRLDGSEVRALAPVPPTTRSGGWAEDGTIVFNSSGLGGLSRVHETGGTVEPVPGDAGSITWLDLLPGGKAVLGSPSVSGERQVVLVPLDTGERRVLFPGMTPRYVDTGHIVFWREGALWAVPFDVDGLEVTGEPALIVQGVGAGGNGLAWFAVTERLLVYQAGSATPWVGGVVEWVDRQGDREPLDIEPGLYAWPRISPDGTKVALMRADRGNGDIWVVDLAAGVSTPLTFDPVRDEAPIWTPDGEQVVFSSRRDGPLNLYRRSADGTGQVERLTSASADQRAYGWTEGGALLFEQDDPDTELDLWSLAPESGSEPVPALREPYDEAQPALSPGGRFIAYQSEELGYPEIFVRPYPGLDGEWLVSTLDIAPYSGITNADPREARSPLWSRDGREIFYLSGPALVSVPVRAGETFTHGTPEVLFEGLWMSPGVGRHHDVSPEGRFLMIPIDIRQDRPNELVVVQNWLYDVERQPGS